MAEAWPEGGGSVVRGGTVDDMGRAGRYAMNSEIVWLLCLYWLYRNCLSMYPYGHLYMYIYMYISTRQRYRFLLMVLLSYSNLAEWRS